MIKGSKSRAFALNILIPDCNGWGKMADKIKNFDDYKKRDPGADNREPEERGVVSQETMDIEIEDPFKFLDEEEREEYILERRKETLDNKRREEAAHREELFHEEERSEKPHRQEAPRGEARRDEPRNDARRDEPRRQEPQGGARREAPRRQDDRYDEDRRDREDAASREERLRKRHEDRILLDKDRDRERDRDRDRARDRDRSYDEYEDEQDEGGVNMDLVVRVASVITGIIILLFIGLFLKTRVFDRYIAPDPDEAKVVEVALPEGYSEKNDTVVVSGASSLNLRVVPNTSSNDTIVTKVDEGTELKRIAVSDDGEWAIVEFEGQNVYGSMKYLKEK